jgi:CRISPR/Cas system-associated exonuclease Cas4 (RecB family)
VVFSDTGYQRVPGVSLVSHGLRLVGKPDFLIRSKEGLIPVEEKSSLAPVSGPYLSQLLQLGVYLIFVEENYGPVPYGVLKYSDRSVRVEFTQDLRQRVLSLLSELKRAERTAVNGVLRSHNSASKCRRCGFYDVCGQTVS